MFFESFNPSTLKIKKNKVLVSLNTFDVFPAPFTADETLTTEFERCPTSDQLDQGDFVTFTDRYLSGAVHLRN